MKATTFCRVNRLLRRAIAVSVVVLAFLVGIWWLRAVAEEQARADRAEAAMVDAEFDVRELRSHAAALQGELAERQAALDRTQAEAVAARERADDLQALGAFAITSEANLQAGRRRINWLKRVAAALVSEPPDEDWSVLLVARFLPWFLRWVVTPGMMILVLSVVFGLSFPEAARNVFSR